MRVKMDFADDNVSVNLLAIALVTVSLAAQTCATVTRSPVVTRMPDVWTKDEMIQETQMRKTWVGYGWGNPALYHTADEILPSLWLGSVCAALDSKFLADNNIKLVISMAEEWPFVGITDTGIRYEHIALHDDNEEDLQVVSQGFKQAADLIQSFYNPFTPNDPGGILIYCNMGISRSTSALVYTLMQMEPSKTFEQHLAHIKTKRPVARPNTQFHRFLSKQKSEL